MRSVYVLHETMCTAVYSPITDSFVTTFTSQTCFSLFIWGTGRVFWSKNKGKKSLYTVILIFLQFWCFIKENMKTYIVIFSSKFHKIWRKKIGFGFKWVKLSLPNYENIMNHNLPTIFNLQKYYHPVSFKCAWALPQSKKGQQKGRHFRKDDCSLPVDLLY